MAQTWTSSFRLLGSSVCVRRGCQSFGPGSTLPSNLCCKSKFHVGQCSWTLSRFQEIGKLTFNSQKYAQRPFLVIASEYQKEKKWTGKATSEVIRHKPEQVWLLLGDFFGLDKWFPTMTTCLPAQGASGQVGCIRFCAGFQTPVDKPGQNTMNWMKEKLLAVDPTQRSVSISMVDGNLGFNNYVSQIKVVPKDGGSEIDWTYEVDPVEGWKIEELEMFVNVALKEMGKRIETALQAYNNLASSS